MTVLDLITERSASLKKSSGFSDRHKLGLSVEGGGMRGIVTAAMLIALDDQGLLDVFDGFYGASSGTTNLAYVLAGQGREGMSVYYDKLASKEFVSPSRAFYGRHVLDMDYVKHVIEEERPLDAQTLLTQNKPFVVSVANITKKRGELKKKFSDAKELRDCVLASLQIPILGGEPMKMGEDYYLDGGLYYVDPFEAAIEDGCTHVLALHGRPANGYPDKVSSGQGFVTKLINDISDGIGDVYSQRLSDYYAASAEMGFGETSYRGTPLYRLAVAADGHDIKRMTIDYEKLIKGARTGYQVAAELFNPDFRAYISFGSD
jgi:predicted patatin/cPLA2 family phospholipase